MKKRRQLMTSLYMKARLANDKAREASGSSLRCGHSGIKWEVFYEEYSDYDPRPFTYLGSLESPNMFNYELSREYNTLFKVWFLERIKAYGVSNGWVSCDISKLCYRMQEPFGSIPREDQMTYPFKETTDG
jgi:hypothetical protein